MNDITLEDLFPFDDDDGENGFDACCTGYYVSDTVLTLWVRILVKIQKEGFVSFQFVEEIADRYGLCLNAMVASPPAFLESIGAVSTDIESKTVFKGPLLDQMVEALEPYAAQAGLTLDDMVGDLDSILSSGTD